MKTIGMKPITKPGKVEESKVKEEPKKTDEKK